MGRRAKNKKTSEEIDLGSSKNGHASEASLMAPNSDLGSRMILRSSISQRSKAATGMKLGNDKVNSEKMGNKGINHSEQEVIPIDETDANGMGNTDFITETLNLGKIPEVPGFLDPDQKEEEDLELNNEILEENEHTDTVFGTIAENFPYGFGKSHGSGGRRTSWREEVELEEATKEGSKQYLVSTTSGDQGGEAKKKWPSLFKDNRSSQQGMKLNYFAPQMFDNIPVVKLTREDCESELNYWNSAIVGYVVGMKPTMGMFRKFNEESWKFVRSPKILPHPSGWTMFRFENAADRDNVLKGGPWTINNRALILKPWTEEFAFGIEDMHKLPIWVNFPGLDVKAWSVSGLSKIASVLGNPLYADKFTAIKDKVGYARVLVEIDISKEIPNEVVYFNLFGRAIRQRVEVEWKPDFCYTCKEMGHKSNQCRRRVKIGKAWMPKVNEAHNDIVSEVAKKEVKQTKSDSSNVDGVPASDKSDKEESKGSWSMPVITKIQRF